MEIKRKRVKDKADTSFTENGKKHSKDITDLQKSGSDVSYYQCPCACSQRVLALAAKKSPFGRERQQKLIERKPEGKNFCH